MVPVFWYECFWVVCVSDWLWVMLYCLSVKINEKSHIIRQKAVIKL